MSGKLKVLFFGGARAAAGCAEAQVDVPADATAAGVLAELCRRYPALAEKVRSLKLAVNGTYASPDTVVRAGDEVAVIPPVAGG